MSSSDNEHHSDREKYTSVVRRNHQRQTNLYVNNFGNDMNEYKLCKLFATYGTITSCKISRDGYDRPKGFGFVNFLTSSMAEDALNNLNGYLLKTGQKLYVNYFQNKEDRREEQQQAYYQTCEDRNLFISNLDERINDRKLKHAFKEYGTVTSVKVMLKDGRSKGYGFVCFGTANEASEAINNMNGKELGSKPIYVALWKSQKDRKQSSNHQYPQKTIARLPDSIYLPFSDHQSQLDSRKYSSLFLSAIKSKQPIYRNRNPSSTDDEEKDES